MSTKSERARALINDPVLMEAFENVRQQLFAQIEASGYSQTKEREQIFHSLKQLRYVKAELEKAVNKADKDAREAEEAERMTVRRLQEQ